MGTTIYIVKTDGTLFVDISPLECMLDDLDDCLQVDSWDDDIPFEEIYTIGLMDTCGHCQVLWNKSDEYKLRINELEAQVKYGTDFLQCLPFLNDDEDWSESELKSIDKKGDA